MSLFRFNFDRPGPGIEKDTPPKRGLARWWEVFTRDYSALLLTNVLVLLCALPTLACITIFYMTCAMGTPGTLMLLLNIPCAVLLGPALAALHRITLLICRDIPFYTWHEFKKAFKQDFKQGAISMVILAFLADLIMLNLYLLTVMENYSGFSVIMLFLSIYIWFSLFNTIFQQIALMELPLRTILKNSVLLVVVSGWRGVVVTVADMVLTYLIVMFAPLVVPLALAGLFAVIVATTDLIYWPRLKQVFIDKNLQFGERTRRSAADEWDEAAGATGRRRKKKKEKPLTPDQQWARAFLAEEDEGKPAAQDTPASTSAQDTAADAAPETSAQDVAGNAAPETSAQPADPAAADAAAQPAENADVADDTAAGQTPEN